MTDPKQIDWSSDEAVVRAANIDGYMVFADSIGKVWMMSKTTGAQGYWGDSWADARTREAVVAFERQHNPQHAPAQLTWQEKRDAVIAKFPQAFDCHWEKEGWHAIFSLPLKDPAHQCLHSEEARGSYDYPFLSAEAAWDDAFKFLFPTTTAPQEGNDGSNDKRLFQAGGVGGYSTPCGEGHSGGDRTPKQEVASVEPPWEHIYSKPFMQLCVTCSCGWKWNGIEGVTKLEDYVQAWGNHRAESASPSPVSTEEQPRKRFSSLRREANAPVSQFEREFLLPTEASAAPSVSGEGQQEECPLCHRSDGWHKAEGHPPPSVGDCRKIAWLETPDEMAYWGVRAYAQHTGKWVNNGRDESDVVTFWMDGPHNPAYPPPSDRFKMQRNPNLPAATPPPALPESGELPPRPKTYSLPTDGGNVALNFCKPEKVTAWIDAAQSRIAELAQHATRMEGLAQAHFESVRELESELFAIRQQRGKGE